MTRYGNLRFANVGDKLHPGERQVFYRALENGEKLEKLGEIAKEIEKVVLEHETF